MKKYLILIFAASLMLGTSCKKVNNWFGKSSDRNKRQEFALLAKKNSELQQQLREDSIHYAQQFNELKNSYQEKLDELQKNMNSGTEADGNVYYVVVGAFKNMKYAESYSEKVKSMGHEGKILDGPWDFHLVTYGTYNTLKNSLPALSKARSGVATESWIYFKK